MDNSSCSRCGSKTLPEYKFCLKCGNPLVPNSTTATGGLAGKGKARLVLVKGDGGDTASYTLGGKEHVCGRNQGIVLFPDDETVSPLHAVFYYRDNELYLQDKGSLNGTYVRVKEPVELSDGDSFICGEQVFSYGEGVGTPPVEKDRNGTVFLGSPGGTIYFTLTQLLAGGKPGLTHAARKPVVTIGRDQADLSFPDDRFMSHAHASIEKEGDLAFLKDANSRNGSFFKLRPSQEFHLIDGDLVFIGRQLLRVAF